ncbi:MAG: hypothetical protein FD128_2237 [Hyphomonadaceae bacterium]|nr:MAG: hypothetical protein FD128_2237 [Hyphomonadaceae bacterium]
MWLVSRRTNSLSRLKPPIRKRLFKNDVSSHEYLFLICALISFDLFLAVVNSFVSDIYYIPSKGSYYVCDFVPDPLQCRLSGSVHSIWRTILGAFTGYYLFGGQIFFLVFWLKKQIDEREKTMEKISFECGAAAFISILVANHSEIVEGNFMSLPVIVQSVFSWAAHTFFVSVLIFGYRKSKGATNATNFVA